MSLPDKFGVLITSNRSVLKKSDTRDIECYFENTIKNNNRIFLSDYITRQIDNHNAEDINKIILNYLNDFIKQIRKNLRTNIRRSKNLNIVESFIKLLNIFGNKIYELEYFSKNPKFKKLCYNQFFSTVVSDPMIQVIFTSDVMNQELKSKVKNLFLKIKKCDPIFYDEWCLSFISKCITEFNKSCLCDNYPIPKNIEAVYNFKNLSKFINTYSKHFNFLNTPVIFDKSNCDLMDTFIEISQLNNQDAFNIFLKQKDTIENVIKAYEILDSKKKDEVQMSMVLNIIENYKNVKSLLSLCQIYITISKYYYKIFDSTSILLNKEIAKIICKNSLYQDLNNILIDMVQSDFCEDVTYLFSVIGNLDDKNICFKRYHQELMLRLSKQYEESDIKKVIAYENSLVHKLTKCFTGSQRYKLKKTIKDVDESAEFNKNIMEEISKTHHDSCKNLPGNFNIINTSYNIWDTNVLDIATRIDNIDDIILRDLSGPLLKFIRMYSKCFLVRTKSKEYLNWYFHTGSVSLNYQSNNGKICLKMLPIQAIILELFNDKDIININEILNHIILNSYDRKEKEKILDIFINFSILKLNYEKVEFNMDIPASSSEINIIEPFFEVSSLPTKWEEEKEIELANNKVDIVKTKINHYLKKSTQTKEDLFKLCKTINVFSLDEEVFDKAIKSMVDQEYIEYNDQDSTYLKLLY